MSYLGALAVILSAFLIWREYSSYLNKELITCSSLLNAIRDLGEKMRCYLSSPREWAEVYTDELLDPFLRELRSGETLLGSFKKLCCSTYIPKHLTDLMDQLFSRLGEGSLETELESIASVIKKLEQEESRMKEDFVKKRKVAGAILGACASGMVIFAI